MNDLIEKLDALEGPDRAVDAEIEAAQGFIPVGSRPCKGGWIIDGRAKESPRYTASIDAAITLIPDHAFWSITMRGEKRGGYHACCQIEGPLDWREGPTPAIALCIAAARAQEATHE